jgi:hypothetical protein
MAGGIIYAHNILIGTPPRGLGRTWRNNCKMKFTGTKCEDVSRIQSAHGRVRFLFCEQRNFSWPL